MTRQTKTVDRGQAQSETHKGAAASTAAANPSANGEGKAAATSPAATKGGARPKLRASRPETVGGDQKVPEIQRASVPAGGDFDLRSLIRETLASSKSADPHVVARAVLDALPDEHLRAACEQSVPRVVLDMVRMARNFHGPRPGSPKWSAVATWERRLRDRIEVGTEEREWRFLADCTRDDLLAAASFRRMQASANLAKADELETIADALDAHGCETVGELPPNVLEEVLAA